MNIYDAEEQDKLFTETHSAIDKDLPPHQTKNSTLMKSTISNKDYNFKPKAGRHVASPHIEASTQMLKNASTYDTCILVVVT